MRSRVTIFSMSSFALVFALLGATPSPSPTDSPAPTVDDILARMAATRKGLSSFSVPVHFDVKMRRPLGVVLHPDGVRYFERPNKEALTMKSVPDAAKAFQQIYTALGTAETWPEQYDMSLVELDPQAGATTYELKGVSKSGGDIDHVVIDVAKDTAAPTRARLFYRNGATIDMAIENAMVDGQYLLPKTETLDLNFPSFAGHAVGHYGDYSVNQPIPDTVWAHSP